jgi:hypothetical protein
MGCVRWSIEQGTESVPQSAVQSAAQSAVQSAVQSANLIKRKEKENETKHYNNVGVKRKWVNFEGHKRDYDEIERLEFQRVYMNTAKQ